MIFANDQQRYDFWQACLEGSSSTIRGILDERQNPRYQDELELRKQMDLPINHRLLPGYINYHFPKESPYVQNHHEYIKNALAVMITNHQDISVLLKIPGVKELVTNSPLFFKNLVAIATKNKQFDSIFRLLALKESAVANLNELIIAIEQRNIDTIKQIMEEPSIKAQLENPNDDAQLFFKTILLEIATPSYIDHTATLTALLENTMIREKYIDLMLFEEGSEIYPNIEKNSWLKLIMAVRLGDIAEIKNLIATEKFAHRSEAEQQLLLVTAARYGQVEALKEIIGENLKPEDFHLIMQTAILYNRYNISYHMGNTKYKHQIKTDNNAEELFIDSISSSNQSMINRFLVLSEMKKALSEIKNPFKVLSAVVEYNNVEALNDLISRFPSFKNHLADNDNSLLLTAILNGDLDLARLLLAEPNVRAKPNFAILAATFGLRDIDFLNEVLSIPQMNAYLNEHAADNNNQLLKSAILYDKGDLVKLLLQLPIVKEKANVDVLLAAVASSSEVALNELLEFPEYAKLVNENSKALLKMALDVGQPGILGRLFRLPTIRAALDANFINSLWTSKQFNALTTLRDIGYAEFKQFCADKSHLLISSAINDDTEAISFLMTLEPVKTHISENKPFYVNQSIEILTALSQSSAFRYQLDEAFLVELYLKHGKDLIGPLLDFPDIQHTLLAGSGIFVETVFTKETDQAFLNKVLTVYDSSPNDELFFLYIEQHQQPNVPKENLTTLFSKLSNSLKQVNPFFSEELWNQDNFNHFLTNQDDFILKNLAHLKDHIPFVIYAVGDSNMLLNEAIRKNHIPLIDALLKLDIVKNAADFNTLLNAAQNKNYGALNKLLEISKFKALAANKNNQLIRHAIQDLQPVTVDLLLTLPAVAGNADPAGIRAGMAQNDVGAALANQPFMKPIGTLQDFKNAVEDNNLEKAVELLDVPEIMGALSKDIPYLAYLVLNRYNDDVVNKIFTAYVANQSLLFDLFDRLNAFVHWDPAAISIQNKLFEYLNQTYKMYGLPLTEIFNEFNWRADDLSAFLADPIKYVELNHPDFPGMKMQAFIILVKSQQLENYIREEQFGRESAMSTALEDLADHHFEQTIEPAFREIFYKIGGSEDEATCIENIEKQIRNLILEKIVEDAKDDIAQDSTTEEDKSKAKLIVTFIQENRLVLLPGTNFELMREAEALFKSNLHKSHAAWRAYDKDCATVSWKNLLTSECKYYAADDVEEAFLQSIPNPHKLEYRKRAAYYYLAAIDERPDCEMNTHDRKAKFVAEIGEIRRAHNEGNLIGRDDPSCTPGHKTRMGLNLGKGHPVTKLPPLPREMIPDILRPFIAEKLTAFVVGKTQAELKLLYDALGLTKTTAEDVLNDRPFMAHAEAFTPEHAAILKDFKDSLGNDDEIITMINGELGRMRAPHLNEEDEIFVKTALADFSGISNMSFLNIVAARIERNPANDPAGPSAQSIVAEKEVQVAPVQLNPYLLDLERLAPMLGGLHPAPVIISRAANLHRKSEIFDVLLPRVEQALQHMSAELPPNINSTPFKVNLTKELVNEFWQTWSNSTMVLSLEKLQSAIDSFNQNNRHFAGSVDPKLLNQHINNLEPEAADLQKVPRAKQQ